MVIALKHGKPTEQTSDSWQKITIKTYNSLPLSGNKTWEGFLWDIKTSERMCV